MQALKLNFKKARILTIMNNLRHLLQGRGEITDLDKQCFSDAIEILSISSFPDPKNLTESWNDMIKKVIHFGISSPPEPPVLELVEVLNYSLKENVCNITFKELQTMTYYQVPQNEDKRVTLISFIERVMENTLTLSKTPDSCF